MKANQEIRQKIETNYLKYWEVAEKVGYSPEHFSKLLRHELKPELKEKVLNAIKEILKERKPESLNLDLSSIDEALKERSKL